MCESLGAAIFLMMVHTAKKVEKYKCTKCGSAHIDIYDFKKKRFQACLDCGYEEELNK